MASAPHAGLPRFSSGTGRLTDQPAPPDNTRDWPEIILGGISRVHYGEVVVVIERGEIKEVRITDKIR